jgi:hypothetical protein
MKIGYDMCYRFGTPPRPAEPLRRLALALGVQPELPEAIQALPLTSIAALRSQHRGLLGQTGVRVSLNRDRTRSHQCCRRPERRY